MKASQFSDAQKAFILKQGADGIAVADICRKAGISQATYFNWKKKYDGLLPTEMRRLKLLEDENAKLRKLACGAQKCWARSRRSPARANTGQHQDGAACDFLSLPWAASVGRSYDNHPSSASRIKTLLRRRGFADFATRDFG